MIIMVISKWVEVLDPVEVEEKREVNVEDNRRFKSSKIIQPRFH